MRCIAPEVSKISLILIVWRMEYEIDYTDLDVSPWGGLALMRQMLNQCGFRAALESCADLPKPGSNRGHVVAELVESFIVSVWCGANRFLHTEVTRQDEALRKVFGWRKVPGNDAYKRFFSKFDQATNQRVGDHLFGWHFNQLRFDDFTLDLDSSVVTRYGFQQGAQKGYNPTKRGRRSHQPLMAFVADCNMVANYWLRPGNASASNNALGFLEDTLSKLGNKRLGLIRLDSGFFEEAVFAHLEGGKAPPSYIVPGRMTRPMQRALAGQAAWLPLDEGIEVASACYQAAAWSRPRRIVMIRQHVLERPHATGRQLKLFKNDPVVAQYRYSCLATNMALPPAEIWRLYRGRANAENRIKELKYDFGMDSFCMRNFFGTEAALICCMAAYNLMSLFRMAVLKGNTFPRMTTLRYKIFAIGAYFEATENNQILKLALPHSRREWFSGLWDASKKVSLPIFIS